MLKISKAAFALGTKKAWHKPYACQTALVNWHKQGIVIPLKQTYV